MSRFGDLPEPLQRFWLRLRKIEEHTLPSTVAHQRINAMAKVDAQLRRRRYTHNDWPTMCRKSLDHLGVPGQDR
jgi:hypothetical protein